MMAPVFCPGYSSYSEGRSRYTRLSRNMINDTVNARVWSASRDIICHFKHSLHRYMLLSCIHHLLLTSLAALYMFDLSDALRGFTPYIQGSFPMHPYGKDSRNKATMRKSV